MVDAAIIQNQHVPGRRSFRPRRLAAALLVAGAAWLALLGAIEPIEAHDRSALATAVRGCVVAEKALLLPFPCLAVDPDRETGTAVIRPPLAKSEVLLVPTNAVTGIESPALLARDAPSYFADAWAAGRFVAGALPADPGWNGLGMAVNSRPTRSQDRLHIHVDCLQPAVMAALDRYRARLGTTWTPFPVPLSGGRYFARTLTYEDLSTGNPFRLLEDGLPGAGRHMADMTLVIAGMTRTDGRPGFVMLAANTEDGSHAMGERLLDHACHMVRRG